MASRFMSDIHEGMIVRSSDGEKLGKVTRCLADSFEVEKGFFFPKEYLATYDEILDIRGDEIILASGRDALLEGHTRKESWLGSDTLKEKRATLKEKTDVRMPLAEEELVAKKHMEKAGEVRITKDVITEQRQVTVPVTREVVRVERVPVSGDAAHASADMRFEKDSISIPLHEERVDLEKHAVVREELRVSTEQQQATQTVAGSVRREVADVDTSGREASGNYDYDRSMRREDLDQPLGSERPIGTGIGDSNIGNTGIGDTGLGDTGFGKRKL